MAPGYHRLSIAEKEAYQRSAVREPAVICPGCDTRLMPADLLGHVARRCKGPRDPGPHAKWIPWRAAVAAGVNPKTLSFWAGRGEVRYRGGRGDRLYLLRDLAVRVAVQRLHRRR